MRSQFMRVVLPIIAGLAVGSGAPLAAQQPALHPVIQDFGAVHPVQGAKERPDPKLTYRVLFSVTKAAAAPDRVNPSIEKVARFLNLLGIDGVRPKAGNVVVVIHGPATQIITTDAVYAARTKTTANPNSSLISALRAAGVSIRVCSQAMVGNEIAVDQVMSGVEIDDAALVTMANLQLRHFVLLTD